MGPLAGAYFYSQVIERTDAHADREHIPVILYGDPRIPDRTAHLLEAGDSPLPYLVRATRALCSLGAEVIAIPCNTAHAYLPAIKSEIGEDADLLDMPRLAVRRAARRGVGRLGILATLGLLRSGIYKAAAEEHGITLVTLPKEDSVRINEMIYQRKAGKIFDPSDLEGYENRLFSLGADEVLLACTELSELVRDRERDALDALACEAVLKCGGRLRGGERFEVLRASLR